MQGKTDWDLNHSSHGYTMTPDITLNSRPLFQTNGFPVCNNGLGNNSIERSHVLAQTNLTGLNGVCVNRLNHFNLTVNGWIHHGVKTDSRKMKIGNQGKKLKWTLNYGINDSSSITAEWKGLSELLLIGEITVINSISMIPLNERKDNCLCQI